MSDSDIRPPFPEEPDLAIAPLSVTLTPTDINADVRSGFNGGSGSGGASTLSASSPDDEPDYDYLVRFFVGSVGRRSR